MSCTAASLLACRSHRRRHRHGGDGRTGSGEGRSLAGRRAEGCAAVRARSWRGAGLPAASGVCPGGGTRPVPQKRQDQAAGRWGHMVGGLGHRRILMEFKKIYIYIDNTSLTPCTTSGGSDGYVHQKKFTNFLEKKIFFYIILQD